MASTLAMDAGIHEVEAAMKRYRIGPAQWILTGVLLVDLAVTYSNLRRLKVIDHALEQVVRNFSD